MKRKKEKEKTSPADNSERSFCGNIQSIGHRAEET